MTRQETVAEASARLLKALDRKHLFSRDLDDDARARIHAQMPTDEEIANDRWNDE